MNDKKFVKLSELVGSTFTVNKSYGFKFKFWDNASKKMLMSDTWKDGYRKIYTLETNKGVLDLGSGQLSSLLEAVFTNGKADIIDKTFQVKSNGKSGMDIRYFFNLVKTAEPEVVTDLDGYDEIDMSSIPF